MAMTPFYMGNKAPSSRPLPKHGEPFIQKVDRNGSQHWIDNNCPKCGGIGYLHGYEHVDGARCWKCNASGFYPHSWIIRTPEYQAKLNKRRNDKKRKENLDGRAAFLAKEGFNSEGKTFVVIGKTYEIKDDLKVAGAKFNIYLNWHFVEKPDTFPTVELTIDDCFTENDIAALWWNDRFDIQDIIKERTPKESSKSEYIGEVGKRIAVEVCLKSSYSFEHSFGYYGGTSYIHSFIDENGNVIIWKTSKHLTEGEKYTLVGTVKEHSEYRETKQTILTRCKI